MIWNIYSVYVKIAQVAPLIESVPPLKYGGTERVVSALTEALVQRGHDVTLFASGDSHTSAHLESVYPKGLRDVFPSDYSSRVLYTHLHLASAYSQQEQFDMIHDHTGTFGGSFAQISLTPVVLTLHGVIDDQVRTLFTRCTRPSLVTISDNQRKGAPDLPYEATVFNGLDFQSYPVAHRVGEYLIFVGRICEQKGLHLAIDVALKSKLPLIIAAKYEPEIEVNRAYFIRYIEPKLSRQIRFIGEVTQQKRNILTSGAIASLHTATWEEPFGLTLIEAMATGCPVIAFNNGSIPEIVKVGVSGMIVDSMDQMAEAIKNISTISRKKCASYARNAFNADHMAEEYERIYERLLIKRIITARHSEQLSTMQFGSKFSHMQYRNN